MDTQATQVSTILPVLISFCPTSKKLPVEYLYLGNRRDGLALVRELRTRPEYQKGSFVQAGAMPETVARYAHLQARG